MSEFQTRYPGFPDPSWPKQRVITTSDGREVVVDIIYSPSGATPCPFEVADERDAVTYQIQCNGGEPVAPIRKRP